MVSSIFLCFLATYASTILILVVGKNNDLSTATAQFGLDLLYANEPSENVFFSPASISFCLGMLYAGANGETKLQLSRALYDDLTDHEIYEGMKNLSILLNDHSGSYDLSIANRIYIQNGFNVLNDYKTMLQMYFGSKILSTDFANNPETVRKDINDWIEAQTNHKIKDMLPENSLHDAVMALVNALYFKGNWLYKFNESNTLRKPFHINENDVVNVDMMKQNHQRLVYYENQILRMLGLPYDGKQLTMYIILPIKQNNLREVEEIVSGDLLLSMVRKVQKKKIDEVQIPKFKFEKQLHLTEVLKMFNVTDIFIPGKADLSGITGVKGDLDVSSAIHNAYLEVNENGTEAAASTFVEVATRSANNEKSIKTFIADQPFLFAIIEEISLNVLFLGRYSHPENEFLP